MADESLKGPDSAYRLAKANAASVLCCENSSVRRSFRELEVARLAQLAGIDFYGGTML